MKRFLILVLLTAAPCWARPHAYSDAAFAKQRTTAAGALEWLSVDDSDWSIFIISKQDWWGALTEKQRKQAGGSCYTIKKMTFCNADFISQHSAIELARILAHEYGHIACACADEGTADSYVDILFHHR